MMGITSLGHWLLVFLIVLLVFGTKRLKEVGQDLGEALRAFREGLKENSSSANEDGASIPNNSSSDISCDPDTRDSLSLKKD